MAALLARRAGDARGGGLRRGVGVGAVYMFVVAAAQRAEAPTAEALLVLSGVAALASVAFGWMGSAQDGAALAMADRLAWWQGAASSFGFLGVGLIGLTLMEMRRGR